MVAITVTCVVLLCALLFLMGIEIGKLLAPTPAVMAPAPVQPGSPASPPLAPAPTAASAPSAPTP
ncbi:hypothetical protein [Variovorax sp. GB4R4]